MYKYDIQLHAGKLSIETTRESVRLDDILDFASRENPKRSFLFVSKILGKYVPVRPHRMRETYRQLLGLLGEVSGPFLMLGLAETATGLGQGVFDCYTSQYDVGPSFYMHTTRYPLDRPLAFSFLEPHSHAPSHALHFPRADFLPVFHNARNLILVDDEITTGNTLCHLARAYLRHNPSVERIVFLTLVSWLDLKALRRIEQELGRPVRVESLIKGEFTFDRNPHYQRPLPKAAFSPIHLRKGRDDLGRMGIRHLHLDRFLPALHLLTDPIAIGSTRPLLILGTGEFNFLPFLLAERLEQMGFDVLFQSTSRSPMAVGNGIKSKIEFPDHYCDSIPNYLYNCPAGRQIFLVYETEELARNHQVPEFLEAQKIVIHG